MPDRKFNSKFHFRFTRDEIAEMESLFKENNYVSLPTKVIKALALKFSKTRHLHGQSYVRSNSVQNWFTRRRHFINKARKGLSSVKTLKPSIPSSVAKMQQSPMQFKDKPNGDDEEASEEESSEGGNFREGTLGAVVPSSSISNSGDERADSKDASPQPVPFLQSPVSDIDSVLYRLAKLQKVQLEINLKSFLDQNAFWTPSGESGNDMVDQAKGTLAKLAGISLVDFKSYRRDFDTAIYVIVEKGSVSDAKKAELLLLHERILEISKENEQAREELSKCNDFIEKLSDAAESANKLMKKAGVLEEKYTKFPQDISAASRRVSELEAALLQAKFEVEFMKGDQDDVYNKLARLRESLESANMYMLSLKSEEAHMMNKRVKTVEVLEKSTEEWVQLTHPKGFTVI